jgi:hypothetical protein
MYVMRASLFPFQREERGSRESAKESESERASERESEREERESEREERERDVHLHPSRTSPKQIDNSWNLDSDSCLR